MANFCVHPAIGGDTMTDQANISEYWDKGDTPGRVRTALVKAGLTSDKVSLEEIAPIDHFHARGLPATIDLANRLPIKAGQHILDIGCGVGGPARYMANRFGCKVSGLDITPGFIEAGDELSKLTGMSEEVDLRVGDGVALPYQDQTFDGSYSQHVTMSVANRTGFFAEAYRVIKPGGFFGLSEHGLGSAGDPHYPLPWADRPEICFFVTRSETEQYLAEAGFERIEVVDTGQKYVDAYRELLAGASTEEGPPALGPHVLGGDDMAERAANSTRCIEENRTRTALTAIGLTCTSRSRLKS